MGKNTEYKHFYLFIRTDNKDSEYPEMDVECFSNITDMLKRIDKIAKENIKQGKNCIRHIDYDYTYFI